MSAKQIQDAIILSKKAQQKHFEELNKDKNDAEKYNKLMLSKNPKYFEELYSVKPGEKYYLDDDDKIEQEFMEAEILETTKQQIKSKPKNVKLIKNIEIEEEDNIINTNIIIPDIETLIIEEKPIKQITKSIFDFDINDMPTKQIKKITKTPIEIPLEKLINVKKAPYDLKPSNATIKTDELNKQLYEMQEKYNNLMKKYNSLGTENKELKKTIEDNKKYKVFYDKANNKKNSIKDWMEEAYTISDDYKYYIKCCSLFEEYNNSKFCDKSISQIAFNKQIELLNILKSKKTGYNCFYGLQEK